MPSTRRTWLGLAGWLLLVYAVAFVASQFEPGAWYEQLRQPPWNPPDWLFGPVWSVLYTLMAIAAWLVWKQKGFAMAQLALTLFIVQLLLNGAWSIIFFGLQAPGWAFAEIVVLWTAILATILAFWKENRLAAYLMIPYLLWVTYAAALNASIWQLNL